MLLEEATVSCEKLHDRGFSQGIENCSISGGKILLDETFKKRGGKVRKEIFRKWQSQDPNLGLLPSKVQACSQH